MQQTRQARLAGAKEWTDYGGSFTFARIAEMHARAVGRGAAGMFLIETTSSECPEVVHQHMVELSLKSTVKSFRRKHG